MQYFFILLLSLNLLYACETDLESKEQSKTIIAAKFVEEANPGNNQLIDKLFDRAVIKAQLAEKKASNAPLIVHLYVPLCDNIHQGIVPTTKTLGDYIHDHKLFWETHNLREN